MSALSDRIRRARESQVEAGGFVFTIIRPTHADRETLSGIRQVEFVARFTTGWNLKEIDLVPGGSPVDALFDTEALREWVADQPEILEALVKAIVDAFHAYAQKKDTAEKN